MSGSLESSRDGGTFVDRVASARETYDLIRYLSQRPEADIETFFVAYGLGAAFASPGRGWGRTKKINAALAEAERQGRRDEVLQAARDTFVLGDVPDRTSESGAAFRASGSPAPADDGDRRRRVFLVQGRNGVAVDAVTALLESVGLEVLEWEQAVQFTIRSQGGGGSPYIGDILKEGMSRCHAVVVLFTPDDMGCVRPDLFDPEHDDPREREPRGRARQNVVFEAGMALGLYPERTVFVELGSVAGFSDLAGRHAVRLDDSPERRQALIDRLDALKCDVRKTGTRWMRAGDLAAALASLGDASERDTTISVADADPLRRARSSAITQWRPSGVMGSHPTDLVVGSIVQVPGGPSMVHDPQGRMASRLRGEAREELLAKILAESSVSRWFDLSAPSFHLDGTGPTWQPVGFNSGEWTELLLEPDAVDGRPPALSAHCRVNTGWIPAGTAARPGLTIATEVRFRLLELSADRRPSEIRHETTPAPAPGAIRLGELIAALVATVTIAETAVTACEALTGSRPDDGDIGLRVAAFSGAIDRVVDLSEFRVIPGSGSIPDQAVDAALPLDSTTDSLTDANAARGLAVDLLAELLERSGRRGAGPRLESLRERGE